MVIIKKLKVEEPMRYFWLKYVRGVNLNIHCASCLVGDYSSHVRRHTKELKNLELDEYPDKTFYLCGVHGGKYDWERNFHCAFRARAGSSFRYQSNGVTIEVENAVRLHIDEVDEDDFPRARQKEYGTCRNWQFAVAYSVHEGMPPPVRKR